MSAKSSTDAAPAPAAASAVNRAQEPSSSAAARPPTSLLFSRGNLVSSRLSGGGDKTALARPSTAVRAVGYAPNNTPARFDEYVLEKAKQQALNSANASVDAAKEVNPQIKYKNLEAKIVKLLESSIVLAARSSTKPQHGGAPNNDVKANLVEALNKAKEAFSLDRTLHRFRDQHGEDLFHNFELTYAVFFNLAEQYENNDMHIEALNTYGIMTKNKMFPHVNQLKLNMGNIYYRMGVYPKAIKMYRMALDSVPNNLKQLRLKITHNIGTLFVKMGQYADAAASFEFEMAERADIRRGIHLMLCYYAMGDVEKIKSTFRNLCEVQAAEGENEFDNENHLIKLQQQQAVEQQQQLQHQHLHQTGSAEVAAAIEGEGDADGSGEAHVRSSAGSQHLQDRSRYVFQTLKCDELAGYVNQRRNNKKRSIMMIVDLISPIIDENYNDGYNWCIEVIKSSNLAWLANELELNKALVYLRQNDVTQAIETLQMYDKKSEGSMTASALTNLSFIYINLGNLEMASHCVSQLNEIDALQNNAMALVNASIIDYKKQNYAAARVKLERALQLQPDSFEANYNLGLVGLRENDLDLAEEQFLLLNSQLGDANSVQHSHVCYQLAKLKEQLHSTAAAAAASSSSGAPGGGFNLSSAPAALQSYLQVLGISAAEIDARLYEKVGAIYEQCQDHQEANQYYNEAYRINPSDIGLASSIGSYYIKLQATERAIYYYERAVLADPNDPNLMLRVASCFRNSYLPPKQYLGMFEKIYARFPDNLTCARALVQVTKSLGLTELHEKYTLEYARLHKLQAEKQNEQRQQQQRLSSASSMRGSSRLRAARNTNDETASSRISESAEKPRSFTKEKPYMRTTDPSFTVHHSDPLGPPAERPRTGMQRTSLDVDSDEEELNTDSLLPI